MVRNNAAGLNRCGAVLWMLSGLLLPMPGAVADGIGSPSPSGGPRMNSFSAATVPLLDFDIPAQPLAAALDQFGVISGRSALFRSTLVIGLNSSPVRGRYAPAIALHLLLKGTGLDVKEVSAGGVAALIVTPVGPQAPAVAAAPPSDADNYDGLVQARVWDAICANPRTAASGYRSLLRFGVDPSGRISKPHLLSSTGDGRRDAALLDILRHVQIDRSPPADWAQPMTMLILPGQDGGPVCDVRAP